MSQIDFEIIKKDDKFFDVAVKINNEFLESSVCNVWAMVAAGLVGFAEFDLFTCTCGVSGCAGYHDPVKQSKTENNVMWLFSEDYKIQEKFHAFERKDFEEKIINLKKEVFTLYKAGYEDMSSYDYPSDEGWVEKEFEKHFNDHVQHLLFKEKFQKICKKEMPFINGLIIGYGDYKSEIISPEGLVKMILNGGFYKTEESMFFWGKVLKICEAINLWVFNGDGSQIEYWDKRSYRSVNEGLDFDIKLNFVDRLYFQNKKGDKIEYLTFNDNKVSINGMEKDLPSDFSIKDIKIESI